MFALVKRYTVGLVWCIAPPEFRREDGSEFTLCQERFIPAQTEVLTNWRLVQLRQQGFIICETCEDEFKLALPVLNLKGRAIY